MGALASEDISKQIIISFISFFEFKTKIKLKFFSSDKYKYLTRLRFLPRGLNASFRKYTNYIYFSQQMTTFLFNSITNETFRIKSRNER